MGTSLRHLVLLIGDVLALSLALVLTLLLRRSEIPSSELVTDNFNVFLPHYFLWFAVYFVEGLHTFRNLDRSKLFISLLRANILNLFLSLAIFYLFPAELTPKLILLLHISLLAIFTGLWRYILFSFYASHFQRKAILIGPSKSVHQLASFMQKHPQQGYKLEALYDTPPAIEEVSKLLPSLVKQDVIVISRKFLGNKELLDTLYRSVADLRELSSFSEKVTRKVQVESLDTTWFLEHCWFEKQYGFNKLIKDVFDKFVAGLAILILIVPFSIILLFLLIFSGRPLFFTQKRAGRKGHLFSIFKLRTMKVDAEKNGAIWASTNDSRVTRIGNILRKTRIDELPQLWNVIKGEMSLIGPRPERPEFIEKLQENLPFYSERHLLRPGITGWAQVNFRYGASQDDSLEKLKYDLYYVKNQSFMLDLFIMVKTVKVILLGMGR